MGDDWIFLDWKLNEGLASTCFLRRRKSIGSRGDLIDVRFFPLGHELHLEVRGQLAVLLLQILLNQLLRGLLFAELITAFFHLGDISHPFVPGSLRHEIRELIERSEAHRLLNSALFCGFCFRHAAV